MIKNTNELEFAIFCIENIAKKLNLNPKIVYEDLTKNSDILSKYIVANYDVLHTQDKDYIIDDILDIMDQRGIKK